MMLTRQQALAILTAALVAALVGLALLLVWQAVHADDVLAQALFSAGRGQMQINDVMNVVNAGNEAAHTFLSK